MRAAYPFSTLSIEKSNFYQFPLMQRIQEQELFG